MPPAPDAPPEAELPPELAPPEPEAPPAAEPPAPEAPLEPDAPPVLAAPDPPLPPPPSSEPQATSQQEHPSTDVSTAERMKRSLVYDLARHMPERGALVGDYEVWGRLGGGGMSDVWLARHTLLALPVVIKTLHTDIGSSSRDRLERLVAEARLMARVPSTRVVRALGAGLHGDTPYLVQEYVDGIDLNELDHARRRALGRGLPLGFVCSVVGDVARGLHAAHQSGVLHRDLKPSNLFFSAEVGVKLGDFGIAVVKQLCERNLSEASGTVRFMAPEALRGEPTDRRADVFGLGATAFDLRYGRPPYPDPQSLLRGDARVQLPLPTTTAEAQFQHLLCRMIEPDRDRRMADLTRALAELRVLAAGLRPTTRGLRRADGAILLDGVAVSVEVGDLARASADGIVNSAYSPMTLRSGVGDALRRAGGDVIEAEALRDGEQPLGACVVTGAGALSARHVLHAVSGWKEASCIGRALQRVLLAADELGLTSLAIPALGTGQARVALEASARDLAANLRWYVSLGATRLERVTFVLPDAEKARVFGEVAEHELLGGSAPERDVGLPVTADADEGLYLSVAPTHAAPATGRH